MGGGSLQLRKANKPLLDKLGSWNSVWKLYSTKVGQLANKKMVTQKPKDGHPPSQWLSLRKREQLYARWKTYPYKHCDAQYIIMRCVFTDDHKRVGEFLDKIYWSSQTLVLEDRLTLSNFNSSFCPGLQSYYCLVPFLTFQIFFLISGWSSYNDTNPLLTGAIKRCDRIGVWLLW